MSDKERNDTDFDCNNYNPDNQCDRDLEEEIRSNSNNIIYIPKNTCGLGDAPDLISDETAPAAILEITSDSDIFLLETNRSNGLTATAQGEETEMNATPSETSPESFSSTKPISVENGNSSQNDATVPIVPTETEDLSVSLLPPTTGLDTNTVQNGNQITPSPISSSHQPKMSTSKDKQSEEKFSPIVEEEQGNYKQTNSFPLSSEDIDTRLQSTKSYMGETSGQVSEHVIKTEDEVPSIANEEKGDINESSMESRAVTAPEVEQQVDAETGNSDKPVFTGCTNIIETNAKVDAPSDPSEKLCETSGTISTVYPDNTGESTNIDESYDASELLLQQQQHEKRPKSDSNFPETEDHTGSEVVPESVHMSSSSKKESCSSTIKYRRKVEKEKTDQKSKRKCTNSGSRNRGKSPIRVVEVYDRTTPVKLENAKSDKPISPYQCKVFPVTKNKKGQSTAVKVTPKQCKLLDKELSRGLQQEKNSLVEALTEYFNNTQLTKTDSPSLCPSSVDTNLVISNGCQRETYMSWIIKEKHSEKIEDADKYGGIQWNPMFNILRKSAYTQVSYRPSLTNDRAEDGSLENDGKPDPKMSKRASKLRLVGQERENDISDAGRTMYQSLKSLQRAIHLSDLLCFRNNAPDLPLGESLSQPGFQQFMESENEIEVLENIVALLGNTKDNVEAYLSSLVKANLVTGDEPGLCKIKISNNNQLNDDDRDEKGSDANDGTNLVQEFQEIVPFTCPSCQSQMDLEISNPGQSSWVPGDRVLPQVYTYLGDQGKISLSAFYTTESKLLLQTVLFNGHMFQVHLSALDPNGPFQGITKATQEYVGQPSHLSLESLLNIIHRCANYIDTRIACSCVWTRQSKRYLFELIERYLEKQYRPATDLSRWRLYIMERELKNINVFAGIIRSLTEELVEAVNKIHFCMQKSRILLSKNLKEPGMPGFSLDESSFSWQNIGSQASTSNVYTISTKGSEEKYSEIHLTSSVETLYEKLAQEHENNSGEGVSVQILMQIVAMAARDIETTCKNGEAYKAALKLPGKKAKRVLRFMNTTLAQLGFSKDIHFGTLIATFLSVVDKLPFFEEFMCEQKVELREKVHKMCLKIIRKLYDLRANLCMQMNWSINLAKNSRMRIREINEINRIRRMKKKNKDINEKIEFLRGSDGSLRASVC